MANVRVLLVDDEPGIRTTLAAILKMHGFDVTTHGNVQDALAAMQQQQFDVLLTDLNIGEPADGFTLVSAMRRTQPNAVNLIITGYPAFETALHAIRNQVDDYLVKPADPLQLIQTIRDRLARHDRHDRPPLQKVSYILRENKQTILDRFADDVFNLRKLPVRSMNRDEVLNHFPQVLTEITDELHHQVTGLGKSANEAALHHGRNRYRQNFNVSMLVDEFCLFRMSIFTIVQEHLLSVDVSTLIQDLKLVSQSLDKRLAKAVEAFQEESSKSNLKRA